MFHSIHNRLMPIIIFFAVCAALVLLTLPPTANARRAGSAAATSRELPVVGQDRRNDAAFSAAPCASSIVYVNYAATGANDGTSWTDAFTDLQSALNLACEFDEVWVAQGTYYPTSGTDRNFTFQLLNGVGVYGGFVGTETLRSQRNYFANETILSGDIGIIGDGGDNSFHVVTGSGTDSTAILDGFTVRDGNGPGGGGIFIFGGGSPGLVHLVVRNNAGTSGGGLFVQNGSPAIVNAVFFDNSANRGGGLHIDGTTTTLLFNVVIRTNFAGDTGGGIYNNGSNSNPNIVNTTIFANHAMTSGGGIYNSNIGTPRLRNTILWKNTATTFPFNADLQSSNQTPDVQYSIVGSPDPRFMNEGTYDVRLQGSSPAIDAGNNAEVPADTYDVNNNGNTTEPNPYDLDNNPRFVDDPSVTNTGAGTPPLVDMGAYEWQAGNNTPTPTLTPTQTLTPSITPTMTPTDAGWTFCANENEECTFSGLKDVRYGADGQYYYLLNQTSPVMCDNDTFGGDPIEGVAKHCDYADAGSVTETPTPTNTATATPTPTATEITTAADLALFKVRVNKNHVAIVKWQTSTESRIAGFKVWRKTDNGKFKLLTPQAIQAKFGGTVDGARYRFRDGKAKRGEPLTYKLEVIYTDGHSAWSNQVQVTVPRAANETTPSLVQAILDFLQIKKWASAMSGMN
jgi:hypothetical protein